MEAIRAATVNAARLLGLDGEIGTLEPGRRADLLAVAGNVIVDLSALREPVLVMRGGRVAFHLDTGDVWLERRV